MLFVIRLTYRSVIFIQKFRMPCTRLCDNPRFRSRLNTVRLLQTLLNMLVKSTGAIHPPLETPLLIRMDAGSANARQFRPLLILLHA